MKQFIKLKNRCIYFLLVIALSSCTKLDLPIESALTTDNFPKTNADFAAVAGPAYTALRGPMGQAYWFLTEYSTDELALFAHGGGWFDGARYMQLHKHNWDADNAAIAGGWSGHYSTISTCNRIISLFEPLEESSSKQTSISELKATRDLAYFYLMDSYGNIPISKSFGDTAKVGNSARADVFKFIEGDIKSALPNLKSVTGKATYGKPTQGMAWALLAKLYLNAEYYTGKPMYNECVMACDSITKLNRYSLDANYLKMFDYDNGPQITDFIFAVVWDNVYATGGWYPARYCMNQYLGKKFSLPFTPNGPTVTLPSFYALFNDPNDVRNKQWIVGKQYYSDGSPVIVKTTNKGLDANYSGSNPSGLVDYQVDIIPNISLVNESTFEIGNDVLSWVRGVENNKFNGDITSKDRNQSNDLPIFRYADILLTKAEAILRGATATNGDTPLTLVNKVRKRAGASDLSSVSLQDILDERGRELTNENWRRNDLIRFGQWEKPWGFKPLTGVSIDPTRRIFPIPNAELKLNSKLIQNPGYN